ncbi:hypothetical protein BKA81DRAFT_375531 [Phyllosticta paracitricarpa]
MRQATRDEGQGLATGSPRADSAAGEEDLSRLSRRKAIADFFLDWITFRRAPSLIASDGMAWHGQFRAQTQQRRKGERDEGDWDTPPPPPLRCHSARDAHSYPISTATALSGSFAMPPHAMFCHMPTCCLHRYLLTERAGTQTSASAALARVRAFLSFTGSLGIMSKEEEEEEEEEEAFARVEPPGGRTDWLLHVGGRGETFQEPNERIVLVICCTALARPLVMHALHAMQVWLGACDSCPEWHGLASQHTTSSSPCPPSPRPPQGLSTAGSGKRDAGSTDDLLSELAQTRVREHSCRRRRVGGEAGRAQMQFAAWPQTKDKEVQAVFTRPIDAWCSFRRRPRPLTTTNSRLQSPDNAALAANHRRDHHFWAAEQSLQRAADRERHTSKDLEIGKVTAGQVAMLTAKQCFVSAGYKVAPVNSRTSPWFGEEQNGIEWQQRTAPGNGGRGEDVLESCLKAYTLD